MSIRNVTLAALGLLLSIGQAQASLITFTATGVAGISGYVQFDDLTFDGTTSQPVTNDQITALSLDVFGEIFSLADVLTGNATYIDSSGPLPIIIEGFGDLADNGSLAIAFWDQVFAAPLDGDASLATGPSGGPADANFYAVQWVATISDVPEPGTLALLGLGLSGLGWFRGRRQAAQA